MRVVRRFSALSLQLDAMRAARKSERRASRARARAAAGASPSRASGAGVEQQHIGAGGAAATTTESRSSGARQGRAHCMIFAPAIAISLLIGSGAHSAATMAEWEPTPRGGHLPRPPVRFSDWERPWSDALQTQQRWLHVAQVGTHGCSRSERQDRRSVLRAPSGVSGEARSRNGLNMLLRNEPQPMSSCERIRLAAGPWALPRPPEPCATPAPPGRAGSRETAAEEQGRGADGFGATGIWARVLSGCGEDGGTRHRGRTTTRLRAKHSCRRGRRTSGFVGQDGGAGGNRRRPRLRGAEVVEAAKRGLHIRTADGERSQRARTRAQRRRRRRGEIGEEENELPHRNARESKRR